MRSNKFVRLLRIVFLALLSICAINIAFASGVGSLGKPTILRDDDLTISSAIPRDYVITPFGYFHPSCVVESSGKVEDAEYGNLKHDENDDTACKFPSFNSAGQPLSTNQSKTEYSTSSIYNGWLSSANFVVNSPDASDQVIAQLIVPPIPTVRSGQTIALFTGLVQTGLQNATILQPVLAWNEFNDNAWSVSAWNCCLNGVLLHSAPVAVAPGDTLILGMAPNNCPAGQSSCPSWNISILKILASGSPSTLVSWNTNSYNQAFNWIFGAVLETYGITQCSQFPSADAQFSRVTVQLRSDPRARLPNAPWGVSGYATNAPQCGYNVGISQLSSIFSYITLSY